MRKAISILLLVLSAVFTASSNAAAAPTIMGPEMKIINNDIIVKTSVSDISDIEQTIKSGVTREIVFTVELMRAWNLWPDEFVVSKKIKKVIRYDNLRDRYLASSRDGAARKDIKFTDHDAMKDWVFSVDSVSLANVRELEPGSYYIRVVVESGSRDKLSLIGSLTYFIPEVEMSLAKESAPFVVGDMK